MSRLQSISAGQPIDTSFLSDIVTSVNDLYNTQVSTSKNVNISGSSLPASNLTMVALKTTISSSGTSVAIPFPLVNFAAPPIVTATIDSTNITSTLNLSVSVQNVTTGGCSVVARFDTGVTAVVVNIIAVGYPSNIA